MDSETRDGRYFLKNLSFVVLIIGFLPFCLFFAPVLNAAPQIYFEKYEDLGIDHVQHGVSVASGVGSNGIFPVRFGVQRSFGCRLCPRKTNEDWPVGGLLGS